MGISGLLTYVKSDPNNIVEFKLHDTYIVIDAGNFVCRCYKESKLPYHYGGEYVSFRKYLDFFMVQFQRCHIQPIFIFDGCQPKEVIYHCYRN